MTIARPSLIRTLLALAALAAPLEARASCSTDGCPLDVRGHDSAAHRFALDVAYQFVGEDQAWMGAHPASAGDLQTAHHVEQFNRSHTTIFTGRGQVLDWLGLSASMPWIEREYANVLEHHTGFFLPYQWNYQGLGDLSLVSFVSPFAQGSPGGGPVTLQLGLKLPTGLRHVEPVLGVEPETSVRPGTGSVDVLAGVQVRHAIPVRSLRGEPAEMPLTLSATVRRNGRGTDGYRVGNEGSANLAAGYALIPAVSLLAQVNSRWMQGDEPGLPNVPAHTSGGYEVLATPGLRARLTGGLATYVYYQFRLYEHVNSLQVVSPYHFTFGTVYSFGG